MKKTILLLFFALIGGAAVSCKSSGNSRKDAPTAVSVLAVDSSSVSIISREFVGVVKGAYTTSLSFGTSGIVKAVHVNEGDVVRKGDLLAELDDRQARNAYDAAKASYDRAEDGYKRAGQVYAKGSLPEVKWVEVQSQYRQAKSLYDISLENLEHCRLTAPCDGVISRRSVEQGMNLTAYTPVLSVMNVTGLEVEIKVPENEISSVRIGDRASFSVPACGDGIFKASVVSKGVSADPVSHSYRVRLALTSESHELLPGMVARVCLDGFASTGIAIPGRSVRLSNDGRHFVWIVKDGKVFMRYVGVASIAKDGIIVSSGLSQGDVVVTDGVAKISEGMSVSVSK